MTFPRALTTLWNDPPPALAFELSEAGIALARTGQPEFDFRPSIPASFPVSPLRDNILDPGKLAAAVRSMVPRNGGRKRWNAALILPDSCVRISVLDFNDFPSDTKEQLALVRFRMKKSVPYDVESAALSYYPQESNGEGKKMMSWWLSPRPKRLSRLQAPFRMAAIEPGFVTIPRAGRPRPRQRKGTVVVAKLSGRMLTIMVVSAGSLKLLRSLELNELGIAEIAADLYPTFVYIEDNLGEKAKSKTAVGGPWPPGRGGA